MRLVCGWIAVAASTGLGCFWAFWGIIENFHEGWYGDTVLWNLGLMRVQYLSPMLLFMALGLVSIRWKWVGGILHAALAFAALGFLRFSTGTVLIATPLLAIGVLYMVGLVRPRRLAAAVVVALPLLVMIACGVEPAIRVAGRMDDGNRGIRLVEGNAVRLEWAPQGPGWPDEGVPWQEARRRCRYLAANGHTLAESPQVIYWWTATEVDEKRAYMIVYNGQVWPRDKRFAPAYFALRAVRDVKGNR
jgi:hypothetical protein